MSILFFSCVTGEFGGYRTECDRYLRRGGVEMRIQEYLPQVAEDTIAKLDACIVNCNAVVQILGTSVGQRAPAIPVKAFLQREKNFVGALRCLGENECLQLTYTEWEAFLAAYRGKKLFVYRSSEPIQDGHPTTARGCAKDWPSFETPRGGAEMVDRHCERLKRLPNPRHASSFSSLLDLLGQFVADLHAFTGPAFGTSVRRHRRFGGDQIDHLKRALRAATELLQERFLLTAFVQITGGLPDNIPSDGLEDPELIDVLADRRDAREFFGFVQVCEARARHLKLEQLATSLSAWFEVALASYNAYKTATAVDSPIVKAELTAARIAEQWRGSFQVNSPPSPWLELAWDPDPSSGSQAVFAEAYLRWGRCRKRVVGSVAAPSAIEAPTRVVHHLQNMRAAAKYSKIGYTRLEIFVRQAELQHSWEYRHDWNPTEEDVAYGLHPWPVVLRLRNRVGLLDKVPNPPDPVVRAHLACRLEEIGEEFLVEVSQHGAFFAASIGDAVSIRKNIAGAVARARLGLWLRKPQPHEAALSCLSAIEGLPLETLPRFVSEKKFHSGHDSPWRVLSLLFDFTPSSKPEFTEESSAVSEHAQILDCLA